MKLFQFKKLGKNMKRRKVLIGIAIGLVVITATVITALFMDAVTINLKNSDPKAGRLLGGGRIIRGDSVMIRAQANPGYSFVNWTNVDGSVASTDPEHRLEVPKSDLTLTANWEVTGSEIVYHLGEESCSKKTSLAVKDKNITVKYCTCDTCSAYLAKVLSSKDPSSEKAEILSERTMASMPDSNREVLQDFADAYDYLLTAENRDAAYDAFRNAATALTTHSNHALGQGLFSDTAQDALIDLKTVTSEDTEAWSTLQAVSLLFGCSNESTFLDSAKTLLALYHSTLLSGDYSSRPLALAGAVLTDDGILILPFAFKSASATVFCYFVLDRAGDASIWLSNAQAAKTMTSVETQTDIEIFARCYLFEDLNNPNNVTKFDVKSDTIYLAAPTRSGYAFVGWYKEYDEETGEFKQPAKDYIPSGSTENVVLYAKWEISHSITYDFDSAPPTVAKAKSEDDGLPLDEYVIFLNDSDNPSHYTADSHISLSNPTCYELTRKKLTESPYTYTLEQTGGTYNFKEWTWKDADGNVRRDLSPSAWKGQDVVLTANWEDTDPSYYSVYKKGNYTYVDIGRYPQHRLSDKRTIAELNELIRTEALKPDPNTGLFSYKGALYVQTKAYPYQKNTYYSDGTMVRKEESSFFLVEPIAWRVLSGDPQKKGSKVMLLSESVLDAMAFRSNKSILAKDGKVIYPNNWKNSDVRTFLNEKFYEEAFMPGEKTYIAYSTVDYSAKTSHFDKFANGKTDESRIYLLSYADTANRDFGWQHWTIKEDSRKVGKATDYAKARGVYASLNRGFEHDAAHWWLLSSGDFQHTAGVVTALGNVGTYAVDCKAIGVRPVMTVKLS